jgi:hypothetical protein
VTLSGEVEFDELYLVAGHKGQPDKVKQAKRPARCRRLKGARGRGTLKIASWSLTILVFPLAKITT